MKSHERSDGLLSDICDGEWLKKHPLFYLSNDALQILLYYDDLEVCNPFSSHAKTHKLGKILVEKYMLFVAIFCDTLGNNPPKDR